VIRILLALATVAMLVGCANTEVDVQEAAKSQKEINAAKDKSWQD
jgi:hypothetical protein